ncbi:PLP-dependent aminotransferase family protein [Sphingomonas sp.]|uniref:MocR-like pyridoxine biosynthesis transcription factor PdxR n=1 Tax=Sphingomonas sp. TaxID=28214 RepID=UPI00286C95A5|nr:PLP-dependent aminotransferase family protein [Sphingomonas sp.]
MVAPDGQSSAFLAVVLDRGDGATLTHQLYAQLRDIILSGRLGDGARMPSTRRLCLDLQVSRTVTLAAYDQLAAEGYLASRAGSGYFVEPLVQHHSRNAGVENVRRADATWDEPAALARPFNPSAQATNLFPHQTWARLLGRSWRRPETMPNDLTAAGHGGLRAAIANHLYALRGVDYRPDQILITSGNSDALQLIVRSFGTLADTVWVEDPGHGAAIRVLRAEGLAIVPVPVDSIGLNVAAGIALDPKARFALITPARQFPLGMPLALNRRLELLNWARDSGTILIEDDYDSEIRFAGRAMPSLAALGQSDSVLSLGSLSKLTFPGLRIGYIAGPGPMIADLVARRAELGTQVATTGQAALAEFFSEGAFAKHLRALRGHLNQRRNLLLRLLENDVGEDVVVLPQEVGMHLTIVLDDRFHDVAADERLAEEAAREGLNLAPLSSHSIRAFARNGFLLGYAGWSEAELIDGVRILAQILKRFRPSAHRRD